MINLYQAMNPGTTYQEAKAALEIEIKKNGLKYSKDYEAEAKAEEEEEKQKWIASQKENNEKQKDANTVIELICNLSHPYLRDYIFER